MSDLRELVRMSAYLARQQWTYLRAWLRNQSEE
jgi:hypothetical protein